MVGAHQSPGDSVIISFTPAWRSKTPPKIIHQMARRAKYPPSSIDVSAKDSGPDTWPGLATPTWVANTIAWASQADQRGSHARSLYSRYTPWRMAGKFRPLRPTD